MRVTYDGPDFGLGKLNNKRAFNCLSVLADLGLLKVDEDTGMGWAELSIADGGVAGSGAPGQGQISPEAGFMTPAVASFAAPPGLARDPLSEIWGDLSDADSAGLLADVRAHGVRQPILVDLDKGTVVDGWHRYRMAALAGRECPAIDVASWPAAEVEAAVQSSNRHRRHSSRKELLGAMARQRLRGEAAPSQTVEQEARFAGVTKRRYQQVLQATREDLGLAPPNSGGRPPAAAVQGDAEALDLDRDAGASGGNHRGAAAGRRWPGGPGDGRRRPAVGRVPPALAWGG